MRRNFYKTVLITILIVNNCLFAFGKAMDISYDQVMDYLSNFFVMEKTPPTSEGQRYMGQTADSLAILEIIGSKQNINQATIVLGMPNDRQDIVIRNSGIMLRFIKNLFPKNDKKVVDWVNSSLDKLNKSSQAEKTKIFGNKKIRVHIIKEMGVITITVRHK